MNKEFHLTRKGFNFLVIYAFVFLGLREMLLLLDLFSDYRGLISIVMYIAGLTWMAMAIERIFIAFTQKLILSSESITFQRIGLTVTVKWGDIQRVGTYGIGKFQECIFAPKAKSIVTGWASFGIYGKEVYFPLEIFADNWRDSELGQQIKQYAPHLFQ